MEVLASVEHNDPGTESFPALAEPLNSISDARVPAGRCRQALLQSSNRITGDSMRSRQLGRCRSASLLAVCACWFVAGCGQDVPQTAEELEAERLRQAEELKEEPKEPFEFPRLNVRPEYDEVGLPVKPGHWTTAALEVVANQEDFRGELLAEFVDGRGDQTALYPLPFVLQSSRPLVLPKEQTRVVETVWFVPAESAGQRFGTMRLLTGPAGREVAFKQEPITRLPQHQYFLVVLADANEYSFLGSQHSITAPAGRIGESGTEAHYRVVYLSPDRKQRVPVPGNPLTWSMIAYLLWDGLDPERLTHEQQQALLDWLHWGGQLLVTNPQSLDALGRSFLAPYLPATDGGVQEFNEDALRPICEGWTADGRPLCGPREAPRSPPLAFSGRKLVPAASAEISLASGDNSAPLIVERAVGRGRVLTLAFPLPQRALRDWEGFDNFLNGAILRRGPRGFERSDEFDLSVSWLDANRHDPACTTQLRYFSRDAGYSDHAGAPLGEAWQLAMEQREKYWKEQTLSPSGGAIIGSGFLETYIDPRDPPIRPGLAAWDDLSVCSELARSTLREAAGIVVPDSDFVLRVLATYLALLVPVNWLIFKALRRIELAWVAAPVISLAFMIVVVRQAQLDIGFVRARSEVCIIEMQPGYARAHVTNYTALYTSLGTDYSLRYSDPTALARPLAASWEERSSLGWNEMQVRRIREIDDEGEEAAVSEITVEGFSVASNSTGLLQSELYWDVGAALQATALDETGLRWQVANTANLSLRQALLVSDQGCAWIGDLPAGQTIDVALQPGDPGELLERRALRTAEPGELNLLALSQFAARVRQPWMVQRGSQGELGLRIVAQLDQATLPPDADISPAPSQNRRAGLLIAQLQHPPRPPLSSDPGTAAQFRRKNQLFDDEVPIEAPGAPLELSP